jgi:hypothetical protein
MSVIIRKPKSELFDDPIHDMNYLSWLKEQVDRIKVFSDLVHEIEGETVQKVITPNKLWECASKFTEFYTTNIAFIAVYEFYLDRWKIESEKKYSEMYLNIKSLVSDKTSDVGRKYASKAATMKEIGYEILQHKDYDDYLKTLDKVKEYEDKIKTQKKFVEALGRQDKILNMLQRGMETELKYLYLE